MWGAAATFLTWFVVVYCAVDPFEYCDAQLELEYGLRMYSMGRSCVNMMRRCQNYVPGVAAEAPQMPLAWQSTDHATCGSNRGNSPPYLNTVPTALSPLAWRTRGPIDALKNPWDQQLAPAANTKLWNHGLFTAWEGGQEQRTSRVTASPPVVGTTGATSQYWPIGFGSFDSNFRNIPVYIPGFADDGTDVSYAYLELRLHNSMNRRITGLEVRYLLQSLPGLALLDPSPTSPPSYRVPFNTSRVTFGYTHQSGIGYDTATGLPDDNVGNDWFWYDLNPSSIWEVSGDEDLAGLTDPSAQTTAWGLNPDRDTAFRKHTLSGLNWLPGEKFFLRWKVECPDCSVEHRASGVPMGLSTVELAPFAEQEGDHSWEIYNQNENVIDAITGWNASEPWTIEAWVRPNPYDHYAFVTLDPGDQSAQDMPQRSNPFFPLLCGINDPIGVLYQSETCWGLWWDSSDHIFHFVHHFNSTRWYGDQEADRIFYNYQTPIRSNRWTHIGIVEEPVTADATRVTFYVNGQLANQTLVPANFYTPTQSQGGSTNDYWAASRDFGRTPVEPNSFIRIGQVLDTDTNLRQAFFRGHIDELRVWRGVRSQSDLTDDMERVLTGTALVDAKLQNQTDGSGSDHYLMLYFDFNEFTDAADEPKAVVIYPVGTVVSVLQKVGNDPQLTTPYSKMTPMSQSSLNGGDIVCQQSYLGVGDTMLCTGTMKDTSGRNISRHDYSWIDSTYFQPYLLYGPGEVSTTVTFGLNDYTFQFTYFADSYQTGSSRISVKAGGVPFGVDGWHIRTIAAGCSACEFAYRLGSGCDYGPQPSNHTAPIPCSDRYRDSPTNCCDYFYRCKVGSRYFMRRNVVSEGGTCPMYTF